MYTIKKFQKESFFFAQALNCGKIKDIIMNLKLPYHMQKLILYSFFLFLSVSAFGQETNINNDPFYQWSLDRYRLIQGSNAENYHPGFQPISRKMAAELLVSIDSKALSSRDKVLVDYLKNDNWNLIDSTNNNGRGYLNQFYFKKSDLYAVQNEDFLLRINPAFEFSYGMESGQDLPLFINTRAAEIRGMIDGKVGFYSSIKENQVRFPTYVKQYVSQYGVVPGQGFWKSFKEGGYDYFTVDGYIDFNATKSINLQFGHDQFKIGQGIRSVLLSDQAPEYLFLKVQTRVWKANYTNLFAELVQDKVLVPPGLNGAGKYPQKYLSLHHLSLNLGKRLNIGFFESVMYGANDGGTGKLDVKYLNPIIFYRAVEHQNGSADNVQVGLDFEWMPFSGVAAYGQFALDEFKLADIREGNGWWGNKFALLGGLKYINAFKIDQLDIHLEHSRVRPYTFSHYSPYGSYSHFRQPLAHIRGANFKETLLDIRYQPFPKMFLKIRGMYAQYGADPDALTNWGGNILKNYTTRVQEYENEIGQGVGVDEIFIQSKLSYMLKQGLFVDLTHIYRDTQSSAPQFVQSNHIIQGSLRLNLRATDHSF